MSCVFKQQTQIRDYLTIKPLARKGHRSIAHEAKPHGLLTIIHEFTQLRNPWDGLVMGELTSVRWGSDK